jgi:hypothetical protein
MVAESDAFQARCNVTSADEAMARIHHPDYSGPALDEVAGVIAVVYSGPLILSRINNKDLRPDSPTLFLLVRDDDRYPNSREWSQIDFENFVGVMVAEIAAVQGQGTRLPIAAIRQVQPSQITPPRAGGPGKDYWLTAFEVEWSRL